MKNIIYARKNTGSEAERAQSIRAQIAEMNRIARTHKLPVTGVMVDDGGKAAKPGPRPVFRKLVKEIKRGNVDGIFTTDFSRFGRTGSEASAISELLRAGKLQWVCTKDRVMAGKEQNAQDLDAFGMAYRDVMRKAVARGQRNKVLRGGFPHRAPWGYRNDGITKTVVPDPDQFPALQQAWLHLLAGKPLAEIAELLSVQSGTENATSTRSAARQTLRRVFRNPFYAGKVRYKGVLHPGSHISVVSESEYATAQELLRTRPEGAQK